MVLWRPENRSAPNTRYTMKTQILLMIALAGLLVGCKSTTPEVKTYQNQLTGETYDLITDNLVEAKNDSGSLVWLNASRIKRVNGGSMFYLEVHYESPAVWLNIEPGDTLLLTIDGQEYRFRGAGSENERRTTKEGIAETAIYRVGSSVIRNIASAKEVRFRVIGANRTIEREFAPENFKRFQEFVSTYLD